MKRDLVKYLLDGSRTGQRVTVCGWVRTRRDSKGGFSFVEINDGSCFDSLQAVVAETVPGYHDIIKKIFPGCSLRVTGELAVSPGSGQAVELKCESIEIFGECPPADYPLQKQRVSFEKLREAAHLRARTNTIGAVARLRNSLAFAVHKFFQERDFYYIHTPIITAGDCEGAGQMFTVTALDPLNPPRTPDGKPDYSADFFGKKTHLTVSGQLEGETCACALGNIYTFGPTFRAENSTTRRHLAEFWMIEPEMAFADLDDDAALAAEFIKSLCAHALDHNVKDLEFLDERVEKGLIKKLSDTASAEFKMTTHAEAVDILRKSGEKFEWEPVIDDGFQTEHEKYLTEQVFKGPVTVRDFPKKIKPFYMRVNDGGGTVAAMDVLLPGVGEIIGGSQREERLPVLLERMTECGLNPDDYQWYADLRRFGTVPHAGFGLGFERIILYCTGMANIRDVIPFPRFPGNADF
jgi:asparaginyl-tRNA synthetase